MERLIEKWQDKISEVTLGDVKPVKIGGETGVFFIKDEDKCPNPPRVAMEVWDMEPPEWSDALKANFGAALKDPAEWAKMCVEKFSADLICLRLASAHPDTKNASPEEAGKTLEKIIKAVDVPLIVVGSG
ncbi:acetyl-CoA decarbonylase/synthase complex subunit delta, partial [Candidatus Omnitrophota bacterium]